MFSKISIKWIMPPLLVLPVVVVAGVLTILAYRTGKSSADDLADQNMQQIHGRIVEHLTRLMDMPPAMNELNKSMLAKGQLSFSDVDRNRIPVFETLNIFPAVSSIVVGSQIGQTMWIIRYPGETTYEYAIKKDPAGQMEEFALDAHGDVSSEQLSHYDFHPTRRPWYKAAIAADGPTWGTIYVWVRGGKGVTLGIPYVEPVRDTAGGVTGVVNTELTLSDISKYLKQLPVGKTGKSFIIERDGNLVANSLDISCMTDDLKRLRAADASDPWIAQAAQLVTQKFGDNVDLTKQETLFADIAGQPMRLVISPFANRKNLNWLIVTTVPDADFLATIHQTRRHSIAVGAIAVLLMLIVTVFAILWLLRPLLALAAHVKSVGEGDLKRQIQLNDNREMAQLSVAINGMVHDLQDRMRLRHALDLAMDVQQNLLPDSTPSVRGVDIAARAKYCDETGGDYYDFLDVAGLNSNELVVALGDVMGHGVAAAMLMATARGMLRSHVRVQGSAAELLTHVNDLLVKDTDGMRFMTMLLMVIDTAGRKLRWSSAGHDAPFLYDAAEDRFLELAEAGGIPLGIAENQKYDEATLEDLKPGQVLVVGTDGLWESRNESDEDFGKERLQQTIRRLAGQSAANIEAGIFDALKAFCGTRNMHDDVTYVVIKFTDDFGTGAEQN